MNRINKNPKSAPGGLSDSSGFPLPGIMLAPDARRQGASRYFTGKPCKHGHIAERITTSGSCTECASLRTRVGGAGRDRHLYSNYGINVHQWESLLLAQHNRCAICNTILDLTGKGSNSVAVDHCHDTGQVRALLCTDCNKGLGFFHDDATALKKASEYIDYHTLKNSTSMG